LHARRRSCGRRLQPRGSSATAAGGTRLGEAAPEDKGTGGRLGEGTKEDGRWATGRVGLGCSGCWATTVGVGGCGGQGRLGSVGVKLGFFLFFIGSIDGGLVDGWMGCS
jgi:hypothetical protein